MNKCSNLSAVKYCSKVSCLLLLLFLFAQIVEAGLLANCKYLEEPAHKSTLLSTHVFTSHLHNLKRCNRTLRIYDLPDSLLPRQQHIQSHFESLLPELIPANIHHLYKLLIAYLLTWEKDFPFESMNFFDSDQSFLLLKAPRERNTVERVKASALEEQTEEQSHKASSSLSPGQAALFMYSLMDPDYPYGFIIRSANGKKTYLICRSPDPFPSPSATQPFIESVSVSFPALSPQQVPVETMVHLLADQLAGQNLIPNCLPKTVPKN